MFFSFKGTATTEIYTLSLHDALPISADPPRHSRRRLRSPGQTGRAKPRSSRRTPPRPVYRPARIQFPRDRKSTRLNSSHVEISYAVFCLKKKKARTWTDRFELQVTVR